MGTRRLILVLCLAGAAVADPVTDAAENALEIFRANGDLKELASKDDTDPWLVADELCARGEYDAAEALAGASPRVDTERLPEYVRSRRGTADASGARAALQSARAAAAKRAWDQAVAALEHVDVSLPGVTSFRTLAVRWLRAKYPEPYHWAAFVYIGDPR